MRFFFYGTLRDPDVRRLVIGPGVDRIAIAPAVLPGWRCVFLRGRVYPVLQADGSAETVGVLADGIDPRQVARLDRFETDEYRRGVARVRGACGKVANAHVYFAVRPGLASTTAWDLDAWQRRWKKALLAGSFGRR
jgi:hypothetical protein